MLNEIWQKRHDGLCRNRGCVRHATCEVAYREVLTPYPVYELLCDECAERIARNILVTTVYYVLPLDVLQKWRWINGI